MSPGRGAGIAHYVSPERATEENRAALEVQIRSFFVVAQKGDKAAVPRHTSRAVLNSQTGLTKEDGIRAATTGGWDTGQANVAFRATLNGCDICIDTAAHAHLDSD